MTLKGQVSCEKCENRPGAVRCSCGAQFCEECFSKKHLERNPTHQRGATNKTEKDWTWISGRIPNLIDPVSRAKIFERDQSAKWFGLYVKNTGDDRVTWLIQTTRFSTLAEDSMHHKENSPRRQFPSITSFVGETGSGKSTLVRSLIHQSLQSESLYNVEAPVPGITSGPAAYKPTTGEVNLYPDPNTFGTKNPQFFADCEGMPGGEPAAADHQKEWFKCGTKYHLTHKNGKPIDRKIATETIYPRLLYAFSDVICMVTRNHKTWADSVVKLLEWSQFGAHNTINQFALPALIIILNAPTIENETWVSEDQSAITRDFFNVMENEISENATLRKMANKHKDKNLKELLLRNFASVQVHYIPLEGFRTLGNSHKVLLQMTRLRREIQEGLTHVQERRIETCSLFDTNQLTIAFDSAVKHLASDSHEPFDFAQCRQQMILRQSTESHLTEFFGKCLTNGIEENFEATARVLGSCIVRHSLKSEGTNLLHLHLVFHSELKKACSGALEQFLCNAQPCAYLHFGNGEKCVNTKMGHAKGHQCADGSFLAEGNFVEGDFNGYKLIEIVNENITTRLKTMNQKFGLERQKRRKNAARYHRFLLRSISHRPFGKESKSIWRSIVPGVDLETRASVCYTCLLGRPEYILPCKHVICLDCVREFDQSSASEKYPGVAIHKNCVLCTSDRDDDYGWPFTVQYCPDLSGLRVLSLDGGGVRGIIQLSILQRLEKCVDLDIPFGELFDLMVGTSVGGMIAIGLGIHNLSSEECIREFKTFCQNALQPKLGTKNLIFGRVVRWVCSSIYKTEPLKVALHKMFKSKPYFGLHGNVSRVAVTTTADDKLRLLANYNWMDGEKYINSNIMTRLAAQCTSAAPMYFEPAENAGQLCRDGGLCENNPIRSAINETKALFGNDAVVDLAISLGCGNGTQSQKHLGWVGPDWLQSLFDTFIKTMNGEKGWENFKADADAKILSRSERLNPRLLTKKEPDLDDTSLIDEMEEWARAAEFYHKPCPSEFTPVVGLDGGDALEVLAYRLKGSLYFFELSSLTQQDDVAIVKGWICCRLRPSDRSAYRSLLEETSFFQVKGATYKVPATQLTERLKLNVTFQQQDSQEDDPIRIDAKFGCDYLVTISGFPITLRKLRKHWDAR